MSEDSMGVDAYEIVLADLRAKKAQIEQAITAIENLRSGTAAPPVSGSADHAKQSHHIAMDTPGAFLGKSIVDAAKMLLAARREPLKNPDIALAFKRGGLVMNSKEPANTIGSVLSRRAADVGDVVKVGRGTWGLKEWYPNRSFKAKAEVRGSEKGGEEDPLIFKPGTIIHEDGTVTPSDGSVALVPFMITQATRDKLKELGVSDDEIKEMTPQSAQEYIDVFG